MRRFVALLVAGSLVLAGCTAASSPIASGPRTITVTGRDDFSWDCPCYLVTVNVLGGWGLARA